MAFVGPNMAESLAFARQIPCPRAPLFHSYLTAAGEACGQSIQEIRRPSNCASRVKRWHSTPMQRSTMYTSDWSGVQCYSLSSIYGVKLTRVRKGVLTAGWMILVSGQSGRNSRSGFFSPILDQHSRLRKAKFSKTKSHEERFNGRELVVRSALFELAGGMDIIGNLGLDSLTFLIATVIVVPTFKALKASPILGFLLSGVVFNQLGLIRNVTDVKALSELGVLFLLFEMGLELSLTRLKALAKYALGIGLAQVLVSTLVFTGFELPTNNALGTRLLEFFFHARPDLVNIRTVDEAVVIGAGLSLSSSAFVLQLLAEKGELPTRFGSATLGILLLQDIAVVPLLVILPILESGNLDNEALWPKLAAESLKALLGLGVLSFGGRLLLRRFFEIVANSRSTEAFVALCLLTVTGTSLLTQKLGFSDTLGAFLAGALLAETNYKTQVEADIRPFRGLLLGLFFVTTGTSIDLQLLYREWPNVLALLGGLLAVKTSIITAIGPRVGLTVPESVRTGLLLSQGGEFAFVVFSLANRLGVLPTELNRLLIIVVVLSMTLTPLLNEFGRAVAAYLESALSGDPEEGKMGNAGNFEASEPVVIIGFGQVGQILANFLSTPLAAGLGGDGGGWPYVAFDLDPARVRTARNLGFPVLYGDGSRPVVLQTAGIQSPKAVLVMYTGRDKSVHAVERLRHAFPTIPIYARSEDLGHLLELKTAGATDAILETTEASLQIGSLLLRGLGVRSDDVAFLRGLMRESMEIRAQETLEKAGKKEENLAEFQARVRETWTKKSKQESGKTLNANRGPPGSSELESSRLRKTAARTKKKNEEKTSKSAAGVLQFQTKDEELPMCLSSIDSQSSSSSSSGDSRAVEISEELFTALETGSVSNLEGVDETNGYMELNEVTDSRPTVTIPQSSDSRENSQTIIGREPSFDDNGSLQQNESSDEDPAPSKSTTSALARLKWRTALVMETEGKSEEDERGVTICALPGNERYKGEDENEELDSIDETIIFLRENK